MGAISTPTHKPAFIIGPYLSPFSSPSMDSENLVAVASGKSAFVLFYLATSPHVLTYVTIISLSSPQNVITRIFQE